MRHDDVNAANWNSAVTHFTIYTCGFCCDTSKRLSLFTVQPVDVNFAASQRRLEKLLHSDRFFKKDFAVVLQPYLEKAEPPRLPVGLTHSLTLASFALSSFSSDCFCCYCFLPQDGKIDLSFFTADCFHFTLKGHEELAKGLWNNMVTSPVFNALDKISISSQQVARLI